MKRFDGIIILVLLLLLIFGGTVQAFGGNRYTNRTITPCFDNRGKWYTRGE